MAYVIKKICPMYGDKPTKVINIAAGATEQAALEGLRSYIKSVNEHILTVPAVPACISDLANTTLSRINDIKFTVRPNGMIDIDGQPQQMDVYTLTKV